MDLNAIAPMAQFLGIKMIEITPSRVIAELYGRPEFANRGGNVHGGIIMAMADSVGGQATSANLSQGQTTSTIESKTNFFASIPLNQIIRAECAPLHLGRTTIVVQTRIIRADGRVAAMITQTQIVLPAKG